MPKGADDLLFERVKFKTRLPVQRLYTAGHMWLRDAGDGLWQVGLTRFAHRMLGEPVDLDLEAQAGAELKKGEVVGWFEGFKAVTDLFSPMSGEFVGGNPDLDKKIGIVRTSTYDRGWIFSQRGEPGTDCMDVQAYADFLGVTIDAMVEAG